MTFLSTVEVAALSYERREKGGGEKEEEGETKGGKRRENCEIAMLIRFQA